MDIGLCLFLADRPFRLGHLEISFGICSRRRGPFRGLHRGQLGLELLVLVEDLEEDFRQPPAGGDIGLVMLTGHDAVDAHALRRGHNEPALEGVEFGEHEGAQPAARRVAAG